jgi:Uma2 family endonuclease
VALPRQQMTLKEFLQLPEEEPALEYEEGRVTQKVSPKGKHSRLQIRLGGLFDQASEAVGAAIAFTELRASYCGRSYVPDVAAYQRERVPVDETGEVADDFREPPDLVAEIISPDENVTHLLRRCLWHVAHGVRLALLVDPAEKLTLVFRPNQVPMSLDEDQELDLSDIIPRLKLRASEIFGVLKIGKPEKGGRS